MQLVDGVHHLTFLLDHGLHRSRRSGAEVMPRRPDFDETDESERGDWTKVELD